jgi:hypothetical protein
MVDTAKPNTIEPTYALAHAADTDAANRRMKKEGRTPLDPVPGVKLLRCGVCWRRRSRRCWADGSNNLREIAYFPTSVPT